MTGKSGKSLSVNVKAGSAARTLAKGKYLSFIQRGEWEYFRRHNCSAIVIIVAMTKERRVLFVEQYRPPVKSKTIEFPAGLVNDRRTKKRESVLAAAKRELLEETGYRAQKLVRLMEGPVSGGSSSDLVTIVLAKGLTKVAPGGGDALEDINVHEVPLDKADRWLVQMRTKGYMIEPKIYAGLYFLRNLDLRNAVNANRRLR